MVAPRPLDALACGPSGTQAWRRFTVLASGGNLESLSEAPAIGSGGIVYIERAYTLTVYYERGKNKQSLGADSDALTDDAERFIGALLRMDYDTPTTGLMRLKPAPWNIVELPNDVANDEHVRPVVDGYAASFGEEFANTRLHVLRGGVADRHQASL